VRDKRCWEGDIRIKKYKIMGDRGKVLKGR